MSDPTTTNIVLAVPTRGSDVGTWDVPNNGDFTIIDACFGSVTAVALSSATPVALTATQAQVNVLRFSGTLSGNIVVTIPAIIKGWSVENLCAVGTFGVYLQNASGGQQIGMPPGETIDVYSDGTNMRYRNLGRVGSYLDLATTAVPAWIVNSTIPPYLNCDGSTFSGVTYPYLAAFLGSGTLPDLKGRNRSFLNQGSGRLTAAIGGVDGNAIFAAGGNEGITLTQGQLPAITPSFTGTPGAVNVSSAVGDILRNPSGVVTAPGTGGSFGVGTGNSSGFGVASTGTFTPAGTISVLGSGQAHPNVQPVQISGISLIRAA